MAPTRTSREAKRSLARLSVRPKHRACCSKKAPRRRYGARPSTHNEEKNQGLIRADFEELACPHKEKPPRKKSQLLVQPHRHNTPRNNYTYHDLIESACEHALQSATTMDPSSKVLKSPDRPFDADASIIAFSNQSLPRSHIADCPAPSLLSLSGEVRNEIYSHLLPDSTNIREVKGLLLSCKQIRAELHGLLMRCAKQALEAPKNVHLHTPQVETYTQLRNVTVQRCCTYSRSSDPRESRDEGSFVDAFANLRALLALHLTYVTVAIPLQFQESFDMQQPLIQFRVLQNSLETFKICNRDRTANAKHIIFDYTPTLIRPLPHPGYRPYMAFIRQESRSHEVGRALRRMRRA